VKKYKAGAVAVALWESEVNINGQMRTVMRASVERRYKDADGQLSRGAPKPAKAGRFKTGQCCDASYTSSLRSHATFC